MLGYGLILDWQAPSMCGGYVNGFAKYFGSNGGNIAISFMAFSEAALIYYMLYGLSYRYLTVRTDPWAIDFFLKPLSFVFLNISGVLFSLGVAISVYSAAAKPELCCLNSYFNEFLTELLFCPERQIRKDFVKDLPLPQFAEQINAVKNGSVAINFNPFLPETQRMAAIIVLVFVVTQAYSLCFGIATMRTIKQNAKNFSKKTLKLHIQFTVLLVVQISTPILFLVLPLLYGVIQILRIESVEKLHVNIGILLMSFYAASNAFLTILFVSPYRKFTYKMVTWLTPNVWIFKSKAIENTRMAQAIVFKNSRIPATTQATHFNN